MLEACRRGQRDHLPQSGPDVDEASDGAVFPSQEVGPGGRNGRKAGAAHGRHHRRPVPQSVDERYTATPPERCECGGFAIQDQIKPQYQEEIVRQKVVRQFDVEIGHCTCCGKRLQGRHPLQTSDALDAAGVQPGAGGAHPGGAPEQAVGDLLWERRRRPADRLWSGSQPRRGCTGRLPVWVRRPSHVSSVGGGDPARAGDSAN
jgi:hypothetical protein